LRALVDSQDTMAMVEALNPVPLSAGDVVFVPAGVLHAIGEGVFLVEVQEPEDLSIVLEWSGFDLDGESLGHLGVGFDLALEAVELRARSADDLSELARPAGYGLSVLPAAADPFFRMEREAIDGHVPLEPGFAILIVTEGAVGLGVLDLPRASTVVVPHAAGPLAVSGRGEVVVARPPAAPAGS
jgi:mannose-6-phosphate isomerase